MPKGKKICPDCGNESGVRTSICGCGHRFLSKQSAKSDSVERESAKSDSVKCEKDTQALTKPIATNRYFSISCPLIQTPAGHCPIKPKGFSKKDWPDGPASNEIIEDWALKVLATGNYLPDAVVYWIHEFWDMNLNFGTEYRRVKEIVLKVLCGNKQEDL